MKAWMVSEKDGDDHACIVFNKDQIIAKEEGASILDLDIDQVDCERRPKYDKYSNKGLVPIKTLINDGWWFECWYCSTHVTSDTDKPLFPKKGVYCSHDCFLRRQEKIQKVKDEFEQFKIEALDLAEKLKLKINTFHGGYPTLTPSAKFTFLGSMYEGTIRWDEGEIQVFVANGDLETFNKHREKINAENQV